MSNILSIFHKLTSNPTQALLESGLNIPANIANNPQSIVQHLLNTGQITQNQVNEAMQMKNNPMFSNLFK